MNKSELIGAVAQKAGLTKKDTEKAINSFIEVVQEALAGGDTVAILGFGTFLARERSAREGNPRTGDLFNSCCKSSCVQARRGLSAVKQR